MTPTAATVPTEAGDEAASPPQALVPLPRLVYVMGAGRSGSTVLGILLGNVPGVFCGGELLAWNHFSGVPISERADVQEFWQAVGELVPLRAEHHRVDLLPLVEHHRALLHPGRLLDPALRARHEAVTRDLLAAIRTESGCGVVVDTSHFPLRARRLARTPGLDVQIIHLARDPRQVIAALRSPVQRARPMGALQANLYCLGVAVLSAVVLALTPARRRIVVRYEDLTGDPRGTLDRLGAFLEVDTTGVRPDDLVVGPLFQGNRLRHHRRLAITSTPPAPPTGTRTARALTWLAQAPVLLRYGYIGPAARRRRRTDRSGPT